MAPEAAASQRPFTTTRTTRKMGRLPLLRMSAELTGGSVSIASTLGAGTRLQAVFDGGHIDCPPLGDCAGHISLLIQGPRNCVWCTPTGGTDQAVTLAPGPADQLGGGISLASRRWSSGSEYLEESRRGP